jgi:hypothetical protein
MQTWRETERKKKERGEKTKKKAVWKEGSRYGRYFRVISESFPKIYR